VIVIDMKLSPRRLTTDGAHPELCIKQGVEVSEPKPVFPAKVTRPLLEPQLVATLDSATPLRRVDPVSIRSLPFSNLLDALFSVGKIPAHVGRRVARLAIVPVTVLHSLLPMKLGKWLDLPALPTGLLGLIRPAVKKQTVHGDH
jgi:hypothetical protein